MRDGPHPATCLCNSSLRLLHVLAAFIFVLCISTHTSRNQSVNLGRRICSRGSPAVEMNTPGAHRKLVVRDAPACARRRCACAAPVPERGAQRKAQSRRQRAVGVRGERQRVRALRMHGKSGSRVHADPSVWSCVASRQTQHPHRFCTGLLASAF